MTDPFVYAGIAQKNLIEKVEKQTEKEVLYARNLCLPVEPGVGGK